MVLYAINDISAFRELYQRLAPRLMNFTLKKTKDSSLADEIVQEVFVKIHRFRHTFDGQKKLDPWVFRILRNEIVDAYRRRSRIVEVATDHIDAIATVEQEATSQLSEIDMSMLSDVERSAVTLRYRDDLSFAKIAKQLVKGEANVRKIISRAVKKLRQE